MASEDKAYTYQDWASKPLPVLPSIADLHLLGDEVPPPYLPPPPPLSFGQRPHPLRANSVPTRHVGRILPLPKECARFGEHASSQCVIRRQSEFAPDVSSWHQMPSPSLTISRSSSVCSAITDAEVGYDLYGLEGRPDPADLDLEDIVRSAHSMLEDLQIDQPYAQGWFQPDNQYSRRLDSKLKGKEFGELVNEFFYRDENRAIYGERQVTSPRKNTPDESQKRKDSQKKHGEQEEARRNRHRECQRDSHQRCPEIAAECGADHAKEIKETRTQAGKGPGKDEQLYAAIYTQEMAGRLVQGLNDRLKRAENVVQRLLQALRRLQEESSFGTADLHYDQHHASRRTSSSRDCYVGMKRKREDMLMTT